MRTQDEIVAFMEANNDFLNFTTDALIGYLDFAHAKSFLSLKEGEGTTEEDWKPLTEESVRQELRAYMAFAWGKVEDHRSISASRSIDKLTAWVWLLGNDKTVEKVKEAGYAQYGAPKLAVICKAYDLPIPKSKEVQRMIQGKSCHVGCEEGCGQ